MSIKETILSIAKKHESYGIDIHPPASNTEIAYFEKQIAFSLPADFIELYKTCNGFGCNEDIFNIVPLADIRKYSKDHGANWFYFSE